MCYNTVELWYPLETCKSQSDLEVPIIYFKIIIYLQTF